MQRTGSLGLIPPEHPRAQAEGRSRTVATSPYKRTQVPGDAGAPG